MVLNTVKEADLKGKRVVIRVDFNVPVKNGVVTDATRIKAALPTINYLIDNGASVVVMSHFGRPKGQKNPDFSMAPIAKEVSCPLRTREKHRHLLIHVRLMLQGQTC